jgi:CDP-alcohol phosphatidyltransferase
MSSGRHPRARRATPVSPGSSVVLVATATVADGGAAALQVWEGEPLLTRLTGQFASLGIERVHVLTRPGWADAVHAAAGGAEVHVCAGAADDLRTLGRIAQGGHGPLVVAYADIVTQREVLAGLLSEPRIRTGVLTTGGNIARPYGFKTRSQRGRIVSAGSPYHSVRRPTGTFLGVLKVARDDRPGVAPVAQQLAELLDPGPPAGWQEELDYKAGHWHRMLALFAIDRESGEPAPPREALDAAALSPEDAAELERRRAIAPDDVTAMLLVGLIRSGVHVNASRLRSLFWARPGSPAALERAAAEIGEHDEDSELLNSAVKGADGFFTTFFVSTYSRYIARWAARRGLTPNQVTLFSIALGVLAAVCFAYAERWSMVLGGVVVYFAFVFDCVDGQLARYTRQFSKLGAWLDSIFDRTKEYVVFAGLAIGASRTGDPVWVLAGAALAMQTTRHAIDFSYPAAQHQMIAGAPQPSIEQTYDGQTPPARLAEPVEADEIQDEVGAEPPAPARPTPKQRAARLWRAIDRSPARWLKKIIQFPIGERFAAIAITAAVADAHAVFVVLLAWGGVAMAYVLLGRTLRSLVS